MGKLFILAVFVCVATLYLTCFVNCETPPAGGSPIGAMPSNPSNLNCTDADKNCPAQYPFAPSFCVGFIQGCNQAQSQAQNATANGVPKPPGSGGSSY